MLTITHKRSLGAVQAVTWLLWSNVAYAAQVTLSGSLTNVPAAAWMMVFILSTVSSLAALLSRLKIDTPPRVGLFVASHVLGSWMAGLLCFLAVEAVGDTYVIHDFVEVILIALASYGGAQLMDRASTAFTNRVAGQLEQGAYGTPSGKKPE